MNRLITWLLGSLISCNAWSMDLYGGLTELFSYESSLPCQSSQTNCEATNGVLGYALDQANEAGLEISNVLEDDNSRNDMEVVVISEKYGACKVETKNLEQLGTLGFLCSSTSKSGKAIKKVDRILSLTKNDDSYTLLDITENTKLKGNL